MNHGRAILHGRNRGNDMFYITSQIGGGSVNRAKGSTFYKTRQDAWDALLVFASSYRDAIAHYSFTPGRNIRARDNMNTEMLFNVETVETSD